MKLYNTESREKEVVRASRGDVIRIYTCGPTVYNFAHIGNFRTYVFEDLLRRTLKYLGHNVHQVMNITDVDDKTIKGALEKGVSLSEFTKTYVDAFFDDLDTLRIERAEEYPAATDHIDKMITIIASLIEKGVAYESEGNVFFRISKFPSYGRLSHLCLDDLEEGASDRVDDEYEKESASDFVLWKAYHPERDGSIFWESPFGKGRPGWHIECSAMALDALGENIDLHIGGVDNIFPHHENEIAQSEAFTNQRFANHWTHSEHLIVEGKKMSKSLGNFFTLRDLLEKGYSGREVRYLLLATHYRTQLNFTFEGLEAARNSIARIGAFLERLTQFEGTSDKVLVKLEQAETHFRSALEDDLNISLALSHLFDLIRELNALLDQSEAHSEATLATLQRMDAVLALIPFEAIDHEEVPKHLLEALEKRNAARSVKDWTTADYNRDLIQEAGYQIKDTPNGSILTKSK